MIIDPAAPYPSLTALAEAYRAGTVKPSAVLRAHLDRIERVEPRIGAFQVLYPDDAMRQAEAADRLFAAGSDLGPFQGIPFGLKDICDVEGRVTTGGSKAMADRISPHTATIARRLLAGGGVMLGKTKTVECALGGWGTNQHMGTPRNPWDMAAHRAPGGSSSGTAASVAAGLAVAGVGTDTGGSVRLPAGFCGLVGLKVTEGRLPLDGILPLSHSLDTPGPLARSVPDAAAMYAVMSGAEGWNPPDGAAEGLRLGVLDTAERAQCSADTLAAYDAALAQLSSIGASLHTVSAPAPFADVTERCGALICAEAWFHNGALYSQMDLPLDEDVRTRMFLGRDILASDYMALQGERRADGARFLEAMTGLDAVLTPTMLAPAPRLEDIDQAEAPSHFTRPVNYYGLCALSVPTGLDASGLPTSLQIIARPHDEATAIRIGAAYEATRGPMPHPDL